MRTESTSQRIYESMDYDKFVFLPENRNTLNYHVEALIASIQKENRLYDHPIIVAINKDKYDIIDGQHRVLACKALGIPVSYIISQSTNDTIISDCQVQRPWYPADFLKYYAKKGYPEYVKLQDILKKYKLVLSSIYRMSGSGTEDMSITFRKGTFKFCEEALVFIDEYYKVMSSIRNLYPNVNKVLLRREFIIAMRFMFREFPEKFDDFVNVLKGHFLDLPSVAHSRHYEMIFIRLYNKHHRKGGRISHPTLTQDDFANY